MSLEHVADELGLSIGEVDVIRQLYHNGGDPTLITNRPAHRVAAIIEGLAAQFLCEVDKKTGLVSLALLDERIRETGDHKGPKTEVVPLRSFLFSLMRSGASEVRGLARVYTFLYGSTNLPAPKFFSQIGKILKLTGPEEAVILLMSALTWEVEGDHLTALLAYAQTKAPEINERARNQAILERQAFQRRLDLYQNALELGEDPAAHYGKQYELDMRRYQREKACDSD